MENSDDIVRWEPDWIPTGDAPILSYPCWREDTARPGSVWPATEDDPLCCPGCGCWHLHHGRVTIYERERGKEDAEHLTRTTVGAGAVAVETVRAEGSRNPSLRRNGLLIELRCERCSERSVLSIEQDKGRTFFRWQT
jgi:hypothetical protein